MPKSSSNKRYSPNDTGFGYTGRFAPSPSGPLHFGSLVTALGSYLQAKKNQGQWLVRIEDIDPPREMAGATDNILKCLEAHHLFWDGEIVFQSKKTKLYEEKIHWLSEQGFTFNCQCTRAQLVAYGNTQLCACAQKKLGEDNCAIRFRYQAQSLEFYDELQGMTSFKREHLPKQFVIKRKDKLYAYQLAVVIDDIEQGITEIARGADLLDTTLFQIALYQAFKQPVPKFLHFPVVSSEPGKKLSKQNHATAVELKMVNHNIIAALGFLGLTVPSQLLNEKTEDVMSWAIQQWDLSKVVAKTELIDNRIGGSDSI